MSSLREWSARPGLARAEVGAGLEPATGRSRSGCTAIVLPNHVPRWLAPVHHRHARSLPDVRFLAQPPPTTFTRPGNIRFTHRQVQPLLPVCLVHVKHPLKRVNNRQSLVKAAIRRVGRVGVYQRRKFRHKVFVTSENGKLDEHLYTKVENSGGQTGFPEIVAPAFPPLAYFRFRTRRSTRNGRRTVIAPIVPHHRP